jgi:hypothetical protein
MTPEEIVKFKSHLQVMHNALRELAKACEKDQDAKIKEAMGIYRSADSKYNDAVSKDDPKKMVAHKAVMDGAMKKLGDACKEKTQDQKIKEAMKIYRMAEEKAKAMAAHA